MPKLEKMAMVREGKRVAAMAGGGDEDAKVGEEKICFVFFSFFATKIVCFPN